MGTLARADGTLLKECVSALDGLPAHALVRGPEQGLVMVRGRTGAVGAPFNLGEMTVTRCSVRLADGTIKEFAETRSVEGIAFAPKGLRLGVARYNGVSLHWVAMAAQPVDLEWKMDGARIKEVVVEKGSRFDGKRLRELGLPKGMILLSVIRGGEAMIPDGETRLHGGDIAIVMGVEPELSDTLVQLNV